MGADLVPTSFATRASVKHTANRPVSRIARLVSRSSKALASEVIASPSNAGHHPVSIDSCKSEQQQVTLWRYQGALFFARSICCRRTLANSEPRCTYVF
jgi:hypothetical protein